MNPTNEQKKWLWKQCGLKGGTCGWLYDPAEPLKPIYPPIGLNSLFQYAVPKLGWCSLEHIIMVDPMGFPKKSYQLPYTEPLPSYYSDNPASRYHWYRATTWGSDGNAKIIENSDDPALALFWACFKAFGGKE